MSRTIDALKLIVEELDEHTNRINKVETKQRNSRKVADHQAQEIEKLKTKVRNMEIREKAQTGTKKKDLAIDYGLTPGRISQITNTKQH